MTKKVFSVVVPAANGSAYGVTVEADYFLIDDNGFLGFSNTKDAGLVASFRDWVYVVVTK
jgi:hypothetical protein